MGALALLFEHFLVVAGVLIAAVSVMIVLTQRRTPQSAVAWLLAMVLVPYLAVPVFLALGFRKQGSRYPSIRFTASRRMEETSTHPLSDTLHQLGAPRAVGGNALHFQESPEAARDALYALLEEARERVDVLFYIIDPDDEGRAFVRRLTQLAEAGVEVRVLLDRLGTLRRPKSEIEALRAAGATVAFFSPFLHPPDRGHMNLRNHRKLVAVDARRVWTGGRNIGRHYLAPGGWADLSCTLEGPAVQHVMEVFSTNWAIAVGEDREDIAVQHDATGEAVVQVIASGPDEPADALHTGLVQAIHAAQQRVWIATPYFVPTEHLSQAIITAARRGLDVRVLVPHRSNKRVTDFARGGYLRSVVRSGGLVLRAPDEMVHAKMGVIDDVAWHGTANFDVRSMLLNFETVLFHYDNASVAQLCDWFERKSEGAHEGMPNVWMVHRVLEGVFRLGSPIL
jgi:cardiolipin synthase